MSPDRRSTQEVIEDHLRRRSKADLERDLAHNYAEDIVLLSAEGLNHGHDGVRKLAKILRSYVTAGRHSYTQVLCYRDVAMVQWTASDGDTQIHDGADSYVVRQGRIVAQTIHYSVRT